jgi:hypothetical protein
LGRLNHLHFLDLSNNQLTGPFPAWAHNLRFLEILNLGQNDISGEIPLVVGEERNDGGHWFPVVLGEERVEIRLDGQFVDFRIDNKLRSLRDFMRLLKSDEVFPHREFYKTLDLNVIKMFYRKHFDYIMNSSDLLWISHKRKVLISTLQETINEYVKAEDNRLLTKAFQTMRRDPLPFINNLKELQQAEQNEGRINDRNSILPTVIEYIRLIFYIWILSVVYDYLDRIDDSKSD